MDSCSAWLPASINVLSKRAARPDLSAFSLFNYTRVMCPALPAWLLKAFRYDKLIRQPASGSLPDWPSSAIRLIGSRIISAVFTPDPVFAQPNAGTIGPRDLLKLPPPRLSSPSLCSSDATFSGWLPVAAARVTGDSLWPLSAQIKHDNNPQSGLDLNTHSSVSIVVGFPRKAAQ